MTTKTTEKPAATLPEDKTNDVPESGHEIPMPPPAEPPTPEISMEARRESCWHAVQEALTLHGFRLVPILNSEPVGPDPVGKALISSKFDLWPDTPNSQQVENHGR